MDSELEQVQDNSFINDARISGDFKGITFSAFKKTDVNKQLLQNMYNSKVEQSCYWSAELICAGHFMDLWEILLFFLGKHIHLGNPKISIYLQKRFHVFRNIMTHGSFYDELQLRNNPTIRNMFAEIICVLCISPKKPGMEPITIDNQLEFDITNMTEKLKAPSADFSKGVLKTGDPTELSIAVNELAFHISRKNKHIPNMSNACYWIEWIISFDTICKKRKQPFLAAIRYDIPVELKFQREVIWIIWDALFIAAEDDPFLISLLNSVLELFCLKFSPACIKKRHYLLYYAVSLVTEPFRREVVLIQNKSLVENTVSKIATVYRQIKKKEITPSTDYLFTGLHDPSTGSAPPSLKFLSNASPKN